MESIAAVVIGFVLTTVAGGWWAARLQERAWLRQNEVRLQEAEQRQAGAACEEIASLLDGLYEDFARVGRDIDAGVRAALAGDALTEAVGRAAAEFEGRDPGSLNDRVYRFGLQLTGQLRDGRVGRHAPLGAVSRRKD